MNNFVFKDSDWRDLGIQLAGLPVSLLAGKKTEIEIDKAGIYEVYLDVSELEERMLSLKIEIDRMSLALDGGCWIVDKTKKYVKVGEIELEKGKHIIKCKMQNAKCKIAEQNLKIILVSKKKEKGLKR